MIYLILAFIFSIIYSSLILYIIVGWNKANEIKIGVEEKNFSVIIPAKNEERYIGACIESILHSKYPAQLIEIIVIDDKSEDNTYEVVKNQANVILIQQSHSLGKKAAITRGISEAKNEYIITLDADCIVQYNWFNIIAANFEANNADVVVGPVKINQTRNDILSRFEFYDTVAMMAITVNGIFRNKYFLANGANLAYRKSVFLSLGGFDDNKNLASGDDVFFVNKAAQSGYKIVASKSDESAVITYAQDNFKALLNQRKRWATKTIYYANTSILGIQAIVFVVSAYIVIAIVGGSFFSLKILQSGILLMVIKMIVDYFFLSKVTRYFQDSKKMTLFFPSFFLYIFMILYMGLQALLPKEYYWKGKKVK
jgi:poly-beta-1,6-N-acetyl-D-glucosamine synthase